MLPEPTEREIITHMESLALKQFRQRDRARLIASYGVGALSIIGLLSAISHPLRSRLHDILQVVPFLVPRTASVTLVFVSIALLMTARGLRLGQRLACISALALLVLSVILHLFNGIEYEEAILASIGAVWLAFNINAFPVRPSRAASIRALIIGVGGTILILIVAIALSASIAHKHIPSTGSRPHTIAARLGVHDAFPLRFGGHYTQAALVALAIGIIVATLWILLSPHAPVQLSGAARHTERERARTLVNRYGNGTLDYFALRDDKQWFFSGNSVVAYAVDSGVCLVSPDPIGPANERVAVWAEFTSYAERSGWSVAVIGSGEDWVPTYEATGLRAVYLGDEAIIDCAPFSLEGRAMRGLRQAVNRCARAGMTVSFHDPSQLDDELKKHLEDLVGLSRHGDAERGFSMTLSRLFDPSDTGLLLSVARDHDGVPQAFVQWVPARDLSGWSLDVMRRNTDSDLPNGVMDFLVVETIRHVASSTGGGIGLNFAVLRDVIEAEPTKPAARIRLRALTKATENTQMESLAKFNEKYLPRWVPRYVILGSLDALAAQGLVIARAEGIVPPLDKLLTRAGS